VTLISLRTSLPILIVHLLCITRFPRLLRLVELDGVVDMAEHRGDAVLVIDVKLEERHHAEIVDQLRDGPVQLLERAAAHQQVLGRRVAFSSFALVLLQQLHVDVDETLQLFPSQNVLDLVHLAQDVDVRDLEHDHGGHGAQGAREELGLVDGEGALEQVGRAEGDVERSLAGQERHERRQDGDVRVQLDLARHVEDDQVLLAQRVQRLRQEVEVLHQELEAVDQAAVGAQAQLLHHVLQRDELADVQVRLVAERLRGRVEVDVEAAPPRVLQVLDQRVAEGRLARARGPHHQDAELGHGGRKNVNGTPSSVNGSWSRPASGEDDKGKKEELYMDAGEEGGKENRARRISKAAPPQRQPRSFFQRTREGHILPSLTARRWRHQVAGSFRRRVPLL